MRTSLHNTFSKKQKIGSSFTGKNVFKCFLLFCVINIFFGVQAFADYTISSTSNIDATSLTGQSGVLTVNGTLTISSNVSLLNFTSIIVNAPSGQIYWTNNSDLTFSSGTTIVIANGALGLQPTVGNGNASQRLVVGTTVISVSSDNSQNAAFSFDQFNALGGLPQFTLATGSTSVCEGNTIALTMTPDRTFSSNYTYVWSASPSVTFSTNNTNSASSTTTNITPSPNTYTITCTVKVAGDLLATKSITVTVNALPTIQTLTGGGGYCSGGAGVALGLGSSQIGVNYQLKLAGVNTGSPVSGNGSAISFGLQTVAGTYTVSATNATTSCATAMGGSAIITLGAPPTAFAVTGGGAYCSGSAGVAIGLAGSQTGINYQLKLNGVNTGSAVPGTGSAISFGLQTVVGNYTVTAANSTGSCTNTMTGSAAITVNPLPSAFAVTGGGAYCSGSTGVAVGLAGSQTAINYQLKVGGVNTGPWAGTLSNGQVFAGNTSPISVSVSPSTSASFTITTLSDANCSAIAAGLTGSAAITVTNAGQWRGITSNWNDGQNWCTGSAPTAGTNVTIPVTANNPIITTGNAIANNLTIAPGASLTLNGGNLKIAGAITSTRGVIVTNGLVELNGSASQAIAGSNFYANTVKDLTINNPVGVVVSNVTNDLLKISGALGFGNVNNSTVYTGDNIVLVSNSTGTARIADVSNNGVNTGNNFNGKVTVQRYFPARRAWRLFTAPLSGAGSIFDNWQNKGVYQQGIGTYVSGTGATNPIGANGLDYSALNNSSLKAGSNLTPVANTRTTLLSKNLADTSDNNAYFIFVRGDRDAANTNPSLSNNTVLSSIGKLQTGRQTFPVSSLPGGYTLIGNPYASPVDFSKLARNNVSNRFYVWDPYLNAEQGGYILIDDADGNGIYTASPSSPGGMSKILQSGQALFVQTVTANAASVTFQETAKSGTTASLTAFRPVGMEQSLRVNIYNTNAANNLQLLDGVYAAFDNSFSKEVDMLDGIKFGNVKEMLAIQRNSKTLTLERRPELSADDTLYLVLTKTTQRSYQLEFLPTGFEASLLMVLEDNYTGTKTTLSPVQKTVYDFVINGAAASAAANRFRVVFKLVAASTLPVTIKDFNALKQSTNVTVNWTVENEINLRAYEVQRSVDGINFSTINTTKAVGANRSTTAYQTIDANPASGNNYYRLRSIDFDGKSEYSKTVVVKMAEQVAGLRIYPNPVTDGVIGVEFKNMSVGTYNTRLTNSVGQVISNKQINHATASGMEYIHQGFKLVVGTYQLEVVAPDNTITIVKVIAR